MATNDPMAQWQEMGQRYWQGLQDMGQQFLKQNPVPAPAAAPWAEGMDQWRKLYQGKDNAGVLDQLLGQGKSWMSTLEQLYKAGSSGGTPDLAALARQSLEQFKSSQPWMGGMGESAQWFDPQQLAGLIGNLGMGGAGMGMPQFGAADASTPAFGFTREQQERLTQLATDLRDYQQQVQRYQALISKAMEGAVGRMQDKLGERSEPGRQLGSLKAVYDLWIDALEESYAEVALSPEFREAYGALVNAQMKVRQGMQTQVERATGDLGMPTRSELDGVHRKVADLRRAMRQVHPDEFENLRAEIVELKRELAALKASGRKAEAVVVSRPARAAAVKPAAPVVAPVAVVAEPAPMAAPAAPAKKAAKPAVKAAATAAKVTKPAATPARPRKR